MGQDPKSSKNACIMAHYYIDKLYDYFLNERDYAYRLQEKSDWYRFRGLLFTATRSWKVVVLLLFPPQKAQVLHLEKPFLLICRLPRMVNFWSVNQLGGQKRGLNPEGTIQGAKRKMGTDTKFNVIWTRSHTPTNMLHSFCKRLNTMLKAMLGETIDEAVITCPAYFDDNQRTATKDAGEIAGFKVLRIINEPTAACLAYGLEKTGKELRILVFDFGGGTLDVTIMDMWKEGGFKVVSTSGDTLLGGTDMNNAIVEHIVSSFQKETGIDLRNDKLAMQRVLEAAEKAKVELSSTLLTDINLPFITADANGPKHLTQSLNRATLEGIVRPIVERCRGPLEQALKDASAALKKEGGDFSKESIDKVIMVGGPTRRP